MKISILPLFFFLYFGGGAALVATPTNARLPTGRSSIQAVYDGDDKIYTFGGAGYDGLSTKFYDDILEYSISRDEVSIAGKLPANFSKVTAVWDDSKGRAYLFGGYLDSAQGWNPWALEFTPGVDELLRVGRFQNQTSDSRMEAFWDGVDRAYMFPGHWEGSLFIRYNRSYEYPFYIWRDDTMAKEYGMAVAWDSIHKMAYLFGGYFSSPKDQIYRFNPADESFHLLSERVPWLGNDMSAVFNGKDIILLGGRNDGVQSTGVALFDPETETMSVANVTGFPFHYSDFGAVWVEKLKRVYLLGGSSFLQPARDQILYIDFSE